MPFFLESTQRYISCILFIHADFKNLTNRKTNLGQVFTFLQTTALLY